MKPMDIVDLKRKLNRAKDKKDLKLIFDKIGL